MFGLIVAGRMVQTDFEQVGLTKCVINVVNAKEVNHVVVFLTGAQSFPEGYGGQIFFCLPNPVTNEIGWSLLGNISNNKPSAIFKISNLKKSETWEQGKSITTSFFGQPAPISNNMTAQIGISIEPLSVIQESTPVDAATASTVSTFIEFSNKMLDNFINYISSFTTEPHGTVPVSLVKTWYENFQRRLHTNPYFWRN